LCKKRRRPRRGRIQIALVRYIRESGLTFKQLARRTGIGLTTIYRLSYGEPGTVENLEKLARVLKLELRRRGTRR